MTISIHIQRQFFAHDGETNQVIRLPPAAVASPVGPNRRVGKPWTKEEHERFLEGLQMYPQGPWRRIATHVGTRTSRQTMTHAQKYRERISRLLVTPGDIDNDTSIRSPPRSAPRAQSSQKARASPYNQPPSQQARQLLLCRTMSPLLDKLDLEILSCLLDNTAAVSDEDASSCSPSSASATTSSGSTSSDSSSEWQEEEDFFGDLLADVSEDKDMLLHLSGLELDDSSVTIGY